MQHRDDGSIRHQRPPTVTVPEGSVCQTVVMFNLAVKTRLFTQSAAFKEGNQTNPRFAVLCIIKLRNQIQQT